MIEFVSRNTGEYETAVVGALLIDDSMMSEISRIISAEDFYFSAPKAVYEAVATLKLAGTPADPVTVLDKASKVCAEVTQEYILEAISTMPTLTNVEEYAKLVREASRNRKLYEVSQSMQEQLVAREDAADIAAAAYAALDGIMKSKSNGTVSSMQAMANWYDKRARIASGADTPAISTGFDSLDAMFGGGMINGGLYICGARPGMGKTTLGISIADNIAERGGTILFASIEMSEDEISAKRVARKAKIPYTKALVGKMSDEDWKRANPAVVELSKRKFEISDDSDVTVQDILFAARRLPNLTAIFIDYLSLIRPVSKSKSRYEEMTGISNDLKRMARTLKVPVLCVAQLNRENENRQNKRPRLSDLRETGSIEQDADAVIFLHNEAYYDRDRKRNQLEAEELEVIVAKNRHGRTGEIKMAWYGATGIINEIWRKS